MKITSMKYLLVVIVILTLNISQAQNDNFNIKIGKNQLLYRNIENTLNISTNLPMEDYKVVLKNCDSTNQIIAKKQCNVVPGKGRVMVIEIIDSKDSNIVHYTEKLKIENLPNPELFYGVSINGSKIDPSVGILFAKYPPPYNLLSLNHSFQITSWKIIIENKIFQGEGRKITEEVKNEIIKNKDAEFLSILAIVKGPDGLARKIGAVYRIK